MTSSQTTVTEGSSLNNERLLREEINVLKTKKDELKNANEQLTTLLDKMAINNQKQIQQINSQSSEIAHLTAELQQLKVSSYYSLDHLTILLKLTGGILDKIMSLSKILPVNFYTIAS